MRKSVSSAVASAVVAASILLLPKTSMAESKIGVASVAKNQVQGVVGGTSRAVSTGSEIFSNETVRTGEASQAQLLFLDQTSLSVGARSEVKLDRFVYNPDRKAGSVVLEGQPRCFSVRQRIPEPQELHHQNAACDDRGTGNHLQYSNRQDR